MGAGQLSGAAAGRHRRGHRVQLRRPAGPRAGAWCSSPSASTGRSASRWCRAWPRARSSVGALGTVYALSASGDDAAQALAPLIAQGWSLATALSLLAWFVFAPQCLATLAAVKRETGGWNMPLVMAGYLFALAYLASFVTYRVALAAGFG